jgi:hypothetical protein
MAFIHSFHSLFCCGIEPLAQIGFRVQGAQKDLESFYQPVRTNIDLLDSFFSLSASTIWIDSPMR